MGIKHTLIIQTLCLSLHRVISAIHREEHPAQPNSSYNHLCIYQQPILISSATPCQVSKKPITSSQGGYLWYLHLHLGHSLPLQGKGTPQTVAPGCHSTENTDLNNSTLRQDLIPKMSSLSSRTGFVCCIYCSNVFLYSNCPCQHTTFPEATLNLSKNQTRILIFI